MFKVFQAASTAIHARLAAIHRDERGQTATEYTGVIVVAVAVVLGLALVVMLGVLNGVATSVADELTLFAEDVLG